MMEATLNDPQWSRMFMVRAGPLPELYRVSVSLLSGLLLFLSCVCICNTVAYGKSSPLSLGIWWGNEGRSCQD